MKHELRPGIRAVALPYLLRVHGQHLPFADGRGDLPHLDLHRRLRRPGQRRVARRTGDWHVGEPADPRTIAALAARGYDATRHRARQFDPEWFPDLDLVVAFDRGQERTLREWAVSDQDRAKVQLLMSFEPDESGTMDVPDPYYSDAALFDSVLATIERASTALFHQLEPGIRQGVS